MRHSRLARRAATAGVCIGVGAAAGIAGSAAAPSKPAPASHAAKARAAGGSAVAGLTTTAVAGPTTAVAVGPGIAAIKVGIGGPPVHGDEVVPNKAGDGFETVTEDSGTVKSVSGQSLTITEGTDAATYATPTLTIPADADVQRNFAAAKLGDIQVGDHVDVSADSDGTTTVFAVDAAHWSPKPLAMPGCGGSLPLPLPPGGTTGEVGVAGSSAIQSAKFAAAARASGSAVRIGKLRRVAGRSGVTSATIVRVAAPGGPVGGIVCSVKTP